MRRTHTASDLRRHFLHKGKVMEGNFKRISQRIKRKRIRVHEQVLSNLAVSVKGLAPKRILDVGTGYGSNLNFLTHRFGRRSRIWSIDVSPATFFVGLLREQYRALLDQVGIKTAELERSGYLGHLSVEEFCLKGGQFSNDLMLQSIEKSIGTSHEGVRFIIMGSPLEDSITPQELMEFESSLGRFVQYPISVICCYECKRTIAHPLNPDLFRSLLKIHGLFQGVGLTTNHLLRLLEPEDARTRGGESRA